MARGLVGRLVQRFEDAGLKIAGVKMAQLGDEMMHGTPKGSLLTGDSLFGLPRSGQKGAEAA